MYLEVPDGWLAKDARASYFGDEKDVEDGQDNGISAFGYHYIIHPELMGVALPTQVGGELHGIRDELTPFTGKNGATATKVRVYSHHTTKIAVGYYVDKGPSARTGRAVDLLIAMVHKLGLSVAEGLWDVDVRILKHGAV